MGSVNSPDSNGSRALGHQGIPGSNGPTREPGYSLYIYSKLIL